MEKGQEEIKEIHRTTKSSSNCFHGDNECDDDRTRNGVFSAYEIPIDLTREVLMRLPAKSIMRFRCLSKLWWSITTQQDFINSPPKSSSYLPER
ncbi:putative F-box protein [Cardamine amara subsp. amara]|uniref:F-box protein n=1 Tax=Cardamine amara subsp. amara TaxID=228776 RepID=A0ABD1A870_CARAN